MNDGQSSNRSEDVSRSIDWYAEGESKTVVIADTQVVVRYIARKGRRARICITAPAAAAFLAGQS